MEELTKAYNPKETEDKIYKLWEESGYFNPDNLSEGHKDPFTILMPPTNANGSLHAGHALVLTIEDIMIRYKRMRGYKTLWLPGLDHAGFETQVVYEKHLEKEGRSRFKMEPKELYDEVLQFTLNNKKNIENQTRKIGASCDWSREKFTLDKDIVQNVYKTFQKLWDDKLLYRGQRIINWCNKHQTSLSELETIDVEQNDNFYYLQYGPFVIATARPETKFGDKYVVMHPDDKRYAQYKEGQKINLEWINGPITATIIKDGAIDMDFGTGVMTITPWHDSVDFEIAQRHGLDKEQIIDFQGKLLPIAGEFAGIKISQARPLIVEKLKSKGLVVKIDEKYKHVIKKCYKCETPIEPQIRDQWFVKMEPLAKPAIQAVENKEVVFIPEQYKKISLHWLNNIIDWNISRQIVWGIPIPAKVCDDCHNGAPDLDNKLTTCKTCGKLLRQDTDTFDTWFSSGQWPFVSLGYPDSKDFKTFYPTDVMETAGEIIFFWVTRMIMFGIYITGKVPFKTVYLHGLVLDAKGQKMSKSKGNVISPLDLTEKYGTDALRIGLIIGNTPGTSLALSEDRIRGYKNFANKVWNIARFITSSTEDAPYDKKFSSYTENDENLRKERHELIVDVTKDMEAFRFYLAAEKIYHYVWHNLADKILEESKKIFADGTNDEKVSRKQLLTHTLKKMLIVLHPFMPFVTEEIYSKLPLHLPAGGKKLLIIESWPEL